MTTCNWPVDLTQCGGSTGCSVLEDLPEEQRNQIIEMAVDFLWNVTGRIFGACPVEIRPCAERCNSYGSTFWGGTPQWANGHHQNGWGPALIGGKWYNISCGCVAGCNCQVEGPKTLIIPGPVQEITRVLIDGQEIDESEYSLRFNRFLTLKNREWPPCQDLLADSTEEGTYAIEYTRGVPVPAGGQIAAGVLACELAKAICGDNDCQLPQRVQTISRQGVTMGFQDMFEGLDDGKTGIWLIDSWITSVNRPRPVAGVRSPDIPVRRR